MKNILCINLKEVSTWTQKFSEHRLNPTFIRFPDLTYDGSSISYEDTLLTGYDFVFTGLTGNFKETAPIVVSYLKDNNIPFLSYSHKNANHAKSFEIYDLSTQKLPIIPSLITQSPELIKQWVEKYTLPIITKPINGRRGRDVLQHNSLPSIISAVENSDVPLIIQPMIPNDGDYRVWILKGEVIGVIKRKPFSKTEFRSNISLGGIAETSELPCDILKVAVLSTQILDLDIAGVDIIQDSNTREYYILEVNAAPQFDGFMKTTGIDLFDIIINHIVQELDHSELQ